MTKDRKQPFLQDIENVESRLQYHEQAAEKLRVSLEEAKRRSAIYVMRDTPISSDEIGTVRFTVVVPGSVLQKAADNPKDEIMVAFARLKQYVLDEIDRQAGVAWANQNKKEHL